MELLSSIPGIALIILGFGALIFVHELGHFLAAKWAGIRTEAFAVGMGPVVASWRKGIGFALGSTDARVRARCAKPAAELTGDDLARFGVGETEYSLRILPIGGFVKMLGQDDLDPGAVSHDPRSYNVCPIGKRMIVVSAGVVMNVLLALSFFVAAFLVGVKFEAPIIGEVSSTLPAGLTAAENAQSLGIETHGLEPGDRVLSIDGAPARTFSDIQIASAMSRPGVPLDLEVERAGVPEPLRFTLMPRHDRTSGLLSVGVYPGRSTELLARPHEEIDDWLTRIGLSDAGVRPGMRLLTAEGVELSTFGQLERVVDRSEGRDVTTIWSALDEAGTPAGPRIEARLEVVPEYEELIQRSDEEGVDVADVGLLGLSPLVRIKNVLDGSPNRGRLEPGDVVMRAGDVWYPRFSQFQALARRNPARTLPLLVRRGAEEVEVEASITRSGRFEVEIQSAEDSLELAGTVDTVRDRRDADRRAVHPTPARSLELLPGARIDRVNGLAVSDWPALRAALRAATMKSHGADEGAAVELDVTHPTPGRPSERVVLRLAPGDVESLHALGWQTKVPSDLFEPLYTTLSAGGSPARAIVMGFRETHKLIVMTYLTIDRLFRGSVGVEQLRGPVGIIDLGARILPKGFPYFIFFLGMISVNLAVLNFLPLPIVDGGLFLFLVYEKLRGRPPSPRFQNAATIIGLFMIGTIFIVTFYNDIARLISS